MPYLNIVYGLPPEIPQVPTGSDSTQTHPVTGKTPDLEADGTIDFADFAYFAQSWL